MAMNRQQKRLLQKQGHVDAEGTPVQRQRRQPRQVAPPKQERTSPRRFGKEVRDELRKVAWPTRSEVVNYSIIVFVALVLLTSFIAAIDFVFGEAVLAIFE